MPGPNAYPVHSQRDEGKAVGIQAEMGKDPVTLKQEGKDGYELYKAAQKLEGKKAIVTGGDSGIGRAAAVMFAMEGADVAVVYLPEEEVDAKETERLILKNGESGCFWLSWRQRVWTDSPVTGRECILLPQDIRDEQGCNRVIETVVQKWGRIDILVNNASVMYDTPSITGTSSSSRSCRASSDRLLRLIDITTEQFDRTMKVGVYPVGSCQAVANSSLLAAQTNIYGTFFVTRAAVPHMSKGSSIIVTASQVAYAGPRMFLTIT